MGVVEAVVAVAMDTVVAAERVLRLRPTSQLRVLQPRAWRRLRVQPKLPA